MMGEQTSGDCNGSHAENGKNNASGRTMTPLESR